MEGLQHSYNQLARLAHNRPVSAAVCTYNNRYKRPGVGSPLAVRHTLVTPGITLPGTGPTVGTWARRRPLVWHHTQKESNPNHGRRAWLVVLCRGCRPSPSLSCYRRIRLF